MGYDDWLFRQVENHYADECEYDENDENSWCDCTACKNKRKYECEEVQADYEYDRMVEAKRLMGSEYE